MFSPRAENLAMPGRLLAEPRSRWLKLPLLAIWADQSDATRARSPSHFRAVRPLACRSALRRAGEAVVRFLGGGAPRGAARGAGGGPRPRPPAGGGRGPGGGRGGGAAGGRGPAGAAVADVALLAPRVGPPDGVGRRGGPRR